MAIFNVNSRYSRLSTLVLVVGALLVIQLLFSPVKSLKQAEFFRWSTRSSLKSILADEEARYDLVLQDREGLVRKWGPKAEDVVTCVSAFYGLACGAHVFHSFPTNGPPYIVCESELVAILWISDTHLT